MSATVVASDPTTAFWARCVTPKVGMRPYVAFRPGSPVKLAGVRIEPPPSLAVQNGTRPAETAADEPPLEPPGVRVGSQGLRVTPCTGLAVKAQFVVYLADYEIPRPKMLFVKLDEKQAVTFEALALPK